MQTNIARPSVASLLLEARFQGQPLSTATGFVVDQGGSPYLVTNWHVVAGRDPTTGAPLSPSGGVPDEIGVLHNQRGALGSWVPKSERLYDASGHPLWLEHPQHRRNVDVVALELIELDDVEIYPHDPRTGEPDVALGVARPLSIVGFPFGITGGGAFGIWVQGSIATEPEVDFNDLPAFLIDSRTRPGQSGSPVVFFSEGGMVPMADGSTVVFSGAAERLIGVYSGRINPQSDLGFVWKAEAVAAILDGDVTGSV